MRTRREAVDWRRARGFRAAERTWGLGATVVIPGGTLDTSGPVHVWSRVIYLVPNHERWAVYDPSSLPDNEVAAGLTLQAACELAIARLTR